MVRAAAGADEIVTALGLEPHPEGGFYRETHRDAASTAIYFLLPGGVTSAWHRTPQTEVFHWYGGAPLELLLENDDPQLVGPDIAAGQRPQAVVPGGTWQAARSTGDYSLVGCTVAPAFTFDTFEMAPPGWSP